LELSIFSNCSKTTDSSRPLGEPDQKHCKVKPFISIIFSMLRGRASNPQPGG
jgi:hypothetical protein